MKSATIWPLICLSILFHAQLAIAAKEKGSPLDFQLRTGGSLSGFSFPVEEYDASNEFC